MWRSSRPVWSAAIGSDGLRPQSSVLSCRLGGRAAVKRPSAPRATLGSRCMCSVPAFDDPHQHRAGARPTGRSTRSPPQDSVHGDVPLTKLPSGKRPGWSVLSPRAHMRNNTHKPLGSLLRTPCAMRFSPPRRARRLRALEMRQWTPLGRPQARILSSSPAVAFGIQATITTKPNRPYKQQEPARLNPHRTGVLYFRELFLSSAGKSSFPLGALEMRGGGGTVGSVELVGWGHGDRRLGKHWQVPMRWRIVLTVNGNAEVSPAPTPTIGKKPGTYKRSWRRFAAECSDCPSTMSPIKLSSATSTLPQIPAAGQADHGLHPRGRTGA